LFEPTGLGVILGALQLARYRAINLPAQITVHRLDVF
jgi:hypothetical protein